ncbi:PilW family protein [Deinococcus hopiensis]|uniref:Type IV pilin N-term methylation site GFxxxE n=1 Tax=Deinococcus hopiensis KR-140 TaxID=695939 RepID=A0A1W1UAB1_9DEIO|nr:prepilin-type N-terminal cleavage/methylation domain-containing protein [Deinococcus hopiensis]SMB77724.1 Type IV pilin N-term methylation site GFxxxE [Deinococcus hopiensis KR-140]
MLNHSQGFTLVELMVAMFISSLILVLTFTLVDGNRKLYDTDSRRVDVNQNLQSALLILTNDLRQAGERLPANFPSLEVVTGTSDTIILRRNILDVVLPVCKDINGGSNRDVVFIAKNGSSKIPANCKDADPNLLTTWKKYRLDNGGKIKAYIYDPKLKRGEMFTYDDEDSSGQKIHHEGDHWDYDYDIDNEPVLYVIEERTYRVLDGDLVMDENKTGYQPVAPNISAMKASLVLKDGTVATGNFPTLSANWKDLNDVNLSLTGTSTFAGRSTTRTLSNKVSLRNAFSADQ